MIIYRYTDTTNNKIYYGKTIKTLEKRHRQHLYAVKINNKSYLHNAMRSHGIENFVLKEIEKCETEKQLNEKEIYYIARDKSNDPRIGYNMTIGGDGGNTKFFGFKHTKETRSKISKAMKGKKRSSRPLHSKMMSGKNNPMFGIHRFGKNSPTFGMFWINNKKLKKNKRVKKEQLEIYFKQNWTLGRLSN